jgi:hypothetical protein
VASGVKVAVRVSVPAASEPAAIVMEALPLPNVVAVEAYVPLLSVTEPVGAPLIVTVTNRDWAAVMLDDAGDTVTVGVVLLTDDTVTDPAPDALL